MSSRGAEADRRRFAFQKAGELWMSDVLEDLRLLTNYEMDSQNRLCLLRVGQTELRRRLGMAVHEPLSQRIVVRLAPQRLVDAISAATGMATGPPARRAAMIARLMRVPAWRGHLRRLELNADRRQLTLL